MIFLVDDRLLNTDGSIQARDYHLQATPVGQESRSAGETNSSIPDHCSLISLHFPTHPEKRIWRGILGLQGRKPDGAPAAMRLKGA